MMKDSLTPRQSKAVLHLMEADTVSEAAELTGVSRTTIYNWMKEPLFEAELARARRADHEARMNKLRRLMPKALSVLSELLDKIDPDLRLKAAKEVIKAYQTLSDSEPPAPPLRPPAEQREDLSPESLRELTQSCISRLLEGSLDARTAQMLPSYLRLLERLKDEEANGSNGSKEADEERPEEPPLERRPAADPDLKALRHEVGQMLETARDDLEAVVRGRTPARTPTGGEESAPEG